MKNTLFILLCPAILLSSCGDSAPSALKEKTQQVLQASTKPDQARELQTLAQQALGGDPHNIDQFLSELMPIIMQNSKAAGGAQETDMMQLVVDWATYGAERGSTACPIILYIIKLEQAKPHADPSTRAVHIPGDTEAMKQAAAEAVKKLESAKTEELNNLDKEALMVGKMLGL